MLKITKSSDPIHVTQLTIVLYGPPGTGKTSMGFTAESPLLLDFDRGAYRAANRGDSVQVAAWAEIENIAGADFGEYKTVVVDTAGRALDVLTAELIRKNPKYKGSGGALSLQGYGALKSAFIGWLKYLHSFGLDIVLLAHSEEQRNGDDIMERLDVQGGSKTEVYKVADAMARLNIKDGKRQLDFNPSETGFGKNPAQIPPLFVPDFTQSPDFLGVVIRDIKTKLNAGSEAAILEQARMMDWKMVFEDLIGPDEFNTKKAEIKDEDRKIKALFFSVAEAKGLLLDRKTGVFSAAA